MNHAVLTGMDQHRRVALGLASTRLAAVASQKYLIASLRVAVSEGLKASFAAKFCGFNEGISAS